jgi:cyclopropane fatty-acyl-phospholipid synthase-like methyltransferase
MQEDTWINNIITRLLLFDRADAARELSARILDLGQDGFIQLIRNSRISHPLFRSDSWDIIYQALREAMRADTEWRYGPNRIKFIVDKFQGAHAFRSFVGAHVLELGCGPQHPLGTTSLYYMNGAARTVAVDLQAVYSERRSAVALLDLITDVLAFPDEWRFTDISETEMLRRARTFDLARLRGGQLEGALDRTACEYRVCDLRAVIEEHESAFDVILSNAVMEHVSPFEEFAALFFRAMTPGGIMFHVVDFVDHRWYLGQAPTRFEYLREGGGTDLFGVNHLRCSQMDQIFRSAGFHQELVDRCGQMDVPEDIIQNLKPEYQTLPASDLRTIQAVMVYRKPE